MFKHAMLNQQHVQYICVSVHNRVQGVDALVENKYTCMHYVHARSYIEVTGWLSRLRQAEISRLNSRLSRLRQQRSQD